MVYHHFPYENNHSLGEHPHLKRKVGAFQNGQEWHRKGQFETDL